MDIQILILLQNFREAIDGFLNGFFAFITTISVDYYMMVPALIMFWVYDKRKGSRVLMSWGTALGLNAFLKSLFCVYRPWIRDPSVKPLESVMSGATGYSFPSGHSSSVSGFYSGIIAAFRRHKGLCIFSAVMIFITMFSRLYVGVHTPQDVLAGAAVGISSAVIVNLVMNYIDKHPDKDWIILLAVGVLCILLVLFTRFKEYPMDYVDGQLLVDPKKMTIDGFKDPGRFFGIFAGWFLERRFVKFSTEGTVGQKVLRALTGALLCIFCFTAIADPLGKLIGVGIVHFVLQAGIPIIFMTLYPKLFGRII